MAIITKPSAIDKGVENVITLNKADLASDTKVVADSYYSDQNNWNTIYITYKTPEGGQVNDVIFDASEATPIGSFNPSLKARDAWEVQGITIQDFDGGSLKLLRGDLTTAEFDVLFTSSFLENTGIVVGNNIAESAFYPLGQSYANAVNHTISSVSILIGKGVSAMTGGTMVMKFYDGATDSFPTGTLLGSSDSIDLNTIPVIVHSTNTLLNDTEHEMVFTFSTPVNVSSAVTLPAFIVEFISPVGDSSSSGSESITLGFTDTNPSLGGGAMLNRIGANAVYDTWFKIVE